MALRGSALGFDAQILTFHALSLVGPPRKIVGFHRVKFLFGKAGNLAAESSSRWPTPRLYHRWREKPLVFAYERGACGQDLWRATQGRPHDLHR